MIYGLTYLTKFEILFYAIAISFVIAHVLKLKWLRFKPFNCMPCLTGWIALALSIAATLPAATCVLQCAAGLFIGSIIEGLIMRYL